MVDDSSQLNKQSADAETPGAGDAPAGANPEETAKEREDRTNRAKAFYRAMYAGEDVVPTDFGMATPGAPGSPGPPTYSGPCPNCQRLESQIADLEKRTQEAENLYKRMAADFENYRRRLEREKEEFQGIGIQKAIEGLLPALDDMDRAKQSLGNVTDPKAMLDGLTMVFTRFTKCMEALGIKQFEVVGEQFDPRLHEPVQEIETQEYPDNAVVHELRRGYSYKDKILRPALVNVASNASGVVIPKVVAEPAAVDAPAAEPAAQEAPPPPEPEPAAQVAAPPPEPEPAAVEVTAVPVPEPEPPVQPEPAPVVEIVAEPIAAPEVPVEAVVAEVVEVEPAQVPPQDEPAPAAVSQESSPEPQPEPVAAEVETKRSRDSKSRAKQSETMDLPKNFDVTATSDLPVFEIDAGDELSLSQTDQGAEVYDLNIAEAEVGEAALGAKTTGKQVTDE